MSQVRKELLTEATATKGRKQQDDEDGDEEEDDVKDSELGLMM